MRKIIIIVIVVVSVGGLYAAQRIVMARIRSTSITVAVLFSEQHYNSLSARIIRSELKRQRSGRGNAQRTSYTFVKIDRQSPRIEETVRQLVADGEQVIISFEEYFVEPLERVSSRFRAQQFYVFTEQPRAREQNDNVHVFFLQTAAYDYLLGYFASLLFHYSFAGHRQGRAAIIGDSITDRFVPIGPIVYGLRSVRTDSTYEYIQMGGDMTNKQILNTWEKLAIDGVEVIILLTDSVPRIFVRAARRNNIALITRAPRRLQKRGHLAQRQLHWRGIIDTHLSPHIRNKRTHDVVIAPNRGYYTVKHRLRDGKTATVLVEQFESLMRTIATNHAPSVPN